MSSVPTQNHDFLAITRRRLLTFLSMLPIVGLGTSRSATARTPTAAEGPFYPTPRMRFADADNNLVKIEGRVRDAGGEVIILKGRVLDSRGDPLDGARVEIWQCDAGGHYLHDADRHRGPYDDAFQGFGHVVTGSDGAFAFRTIKPVPYPGRTPHIHVKVLYNSKDFTTQFYLADHPLNKGDWLFQRMSRSEQKAVSMVFDKVASVPEAVVDIHLG